METALAALFKHTRSFALIRRKVMARRWSHGRRVLFVQVRFSLGPRSNRRNGKLTRGTALASGARQRE